MNRLDISKMASGGLALVLEPSASWGQFRRYAQQWLDRLGATPLSEPSITENECLWEVALDGGEFWITYDDWQQAIQLEPKEAVYNNIIVELQQRLRHHPT